MGNRKMFIKKYRKYIAGKKEAVELEKICSAFELQIISDDNSNTLLQEGEISSESCTGTGCPKKGFHITYHPYTYDTEDYIYPYIRFFKHVYELLCQKDIKVISFYEFYNAKKLNPGIYFVMYR